MSKAVATTNFVIAPPLTWDSALAAAAATGVPQLPQKRSPATSGRSQLAQLTSPSTAPQEAQNFPVPVSPHRGQRTPVCLVGSGIALSLTARHAIGASACGAEATIRASAHHSSGRARSAPWRTAATTAAHFGSPLFHLGH